MRVSAPDLRGGRSTNVKIPTSRKRRETWGTLIVLLTQCSGARFALRRESCIENTGVWCERPECQHGECRADHRGGRRREIVSPGGWHADSGGRRDEPGG